MFKDIKLSPISIHRLSTVIKKAIDEKLPGGVYNVAGSNHLSKYDFGIKSAEVFGLNSGFIYPTTIEKSSLIAIRPKNMSISNKKICNALNIQFPDIKQELELIRDSEHLYTQILQ